ERAAATGRIEPGLYAAGWLRRGPVGAIPTQRTDARELAEVIAADLERDDAQQRVGMPALRSDLARATTWDGWLLIDAHEKANNAEPRPRTKLTDARQMRLLAASATDLPRSASEDTAVELNNAHLPKLTIAYATESGNAELVAEQLVLHLADRTNASTVDLATLTPDQLQTDTPMLLVTSSYDEGELPTSIRALHAQVVTQGTDLSSLHYGLFGLGDTSYEFFSRGADILDQSLQALRARRIGEIGRHDAGGRTLATEAAARWADTIITELMVTSVKEVAAK
ncbi:MAG: monooxygenase, partial [Micrococcus sp.]|nr:monooxygenase [Micrococcus sp.]